MAKNNGKRFEANFKKSCEKDNILFERFVDSNKQSNYSVGTRFTPENPCDGFVFYNGKLVYLELKSTTTGSLSYNIPPNIKIKGKQYDIKPHQVEALMKRSEYDNVIAGLVIDFSERTTKTKTINGATYFIEINAFFDYVINNGKKSINLQDAQQIGIKVDKTLKRTNYTYHIKDFLNNILN